MKKAIFIILIVMVVCMASAFASAEEFDFSGMSFRELMALRTRLLAEIVSRPEWFEVKVPAGTWKVGEDIPAGAYSVRSASGELARFAAKTASGRDVEYIWLSKDKELGKVELEEGYIVELTDYVIFAPPIIAWEVKYAP